MLWTDVVDPAQLTGYARMALTEYEEARGGSLARFLPNREIGDIVARFFQGKTGLVDVAQFRAYDAEPEFGRRPTGRRVSIELPALGQQIPVTEYEQLRMRAGDIPDEAALVTIENTVDTVVRAVADAVERMRGIVLTTGKATINQANYVSDDDFGRPASHTVTAATLWTDETTSRLDYLQTICDTYRDSTGEDPGVLLMSNRVYRALIAGGEFVNPLMPTARATDQQVADVLAGAGLPLIERYDRRVSVNGVSQRVVPDTHILALPAPVDVNAWQATDLGATFWGRTLTSTDPEWNLGLADQPGLVAGVWKNDKPPMGLEIISDAIALPVLANAERSLAAKVL